MQGQHLYLAKPPPLREHKIRSTLNLYFCSLSNDARDNLGASGLVGPEPSEQFRTHANAFRPVILSPQNGRLPGAGRRKRKWVRSQTWVQVVGGKNLVRGAPRV